MKKREKHGCTNTRIYKIYRGMKTRCYDKNDYHYKWYGEKGVKVCDEWLNSFLSFRDWSINNGYKENLSIDRINNNGDYCPENCRWVSHKEQCNNKSSNVIIEIDGKIHTLTEWSKISGVHRKAISRKLAKGITGKDLLKPVTTPVKCQIIQKDLEGNIIKIWNNLQEIGNNTNFGKASIAKVCKNEAYHKTAYGYKWEYKKED